MLLLIVAPTAPVPAAVLVALFGLFAIGAVVSHARGRHDR